MKSCLRYFFSAAFISINICLQVFSCPILPLVEFKDNSVIQVGARAVLISYFEASKKGDAKTASSLIDYEEWAKDMNLQDDAKKRWIEMHKGSLQEDYDMQKKDGSSKEYKILSSEEKGNEAIFKVSQERAMGKYIWEIRIIRKSPLQIGGSKWRIKGFYLKGVNGDQEQIFQIMD